MRFVYIYLIGYFVLVAGALIALWQGHVLSHIPVIWILIGLIVAVGLGIMLAVTSGKPSIISDKG